MTPAAMVFAAGFGKRMGALTRNLPKPMVPLCGQPMIDRAIQSLRDHGVERIVVNTHYLPHLIQPHLDRKDVTSIFEPEILETGGGLKNALPVLKTDPVITINSDAVFIGPSPLKELEAAWDPALDGCLLLVPDTRPESDFDLVSGRLRRKGGYRYTGLQIIRTHRLGEINKFAFSLNEYWDILLKENRLQGAVYSGEWMDIGTPDGLKIAEERLKET